MSYSPILTTSPVTDAPTSFSIEQREPTTQGKLLTFTIYPSKAMTLPTCLHCVKSFLLKLANAELTKSSWPIFSIVGFSVLISMI